AAPYARADDRGGDVPDPAQHHLGASARSPEGAAVDFELSADQVALRDGIRSLCEGRFPIKRVRDGFDRAAHAELAEAGVFSLRSDGFGIADAAVVFEELGRAVVPGPLVWLRSEERRVGKECRS